MYLIQIKHPHLLDLITFPLPPYEAMIRRHDALQQEVLCYRFAGNTTGDSAQALYFLQRVQLLPTSWSGIIYNEASGDEWSFGSWYPFALRVCEQEWLASSRRRATTVHMFPGARGTLAIRWREEAIFSYPDDAVERLLFPYPDSEEHPLDELIAERLTRLIPPV